MKRHGSFGREEVSKRGFLRFPQLHLAWFTLGIVVVACQQAITSTPDHTFPTLISAVTATPSQAPPTLASTATATPSQAPPLPSETAAPTGTAVPTQPPFSHRIGVRLVNGAGEFYDKVSGQKFVPRGNNYIRLARQRTTSGETIQFHSTFNVGLYEPARAEAALQRMHADGYNIVRVFLNGCCAQGSLGDPAGGLSQAYIHNLVDFLHKAWANDLFVLVSTDGPPAVGGYTEILDTTWSEDFAGNSASFLRTGGLRAEAKFWYDLSRALIIQGAPLDALFAYQLRNELFFESNLPPLSLPSGIVQTANGKSYDMASAEDKQRMMDEGLIYWINATRAAILKEDPTALVTVGFFWPQKPHPSRIGDPRVIETRPAIWESQADFIDLHPYPGFRLNLPQYVDNFGMTGIEAKPILMGEFGAARSSYATVARTAQALHDWQVESCSYGFDGWLLWTWDTDEQPDFYNALTGEGEINQALAPIHRPDPCQASAFSFFEHNLALGMRVQASRSLPDQKPSGAVDGDTKTWWVAGDVAPQWIRIDLGKPATVNMIRLVVTQSPAGNTLHQVWAGSAGDQLSLVHVFEGYTEDGQVLEFKPDTPIENIRFILIATRQSPSWVGWKEIEVIAGG